VTTVAAALAEALGNREQAKAAAAKAPAALLADTLGALRASTPHTTAEAMVRDMYDHIISNELAHRAE
jgi:hypothetical protein